MVYQGLSLGIGSVDATSIETYKMFAAADNSARANFRHVYSGQNDTNYYYYKRQNPRRMSLEDLYATGLNPDGSDADSAIRFRPDLSAAADKKTLYRIEGYVSQKVGSSFYIQDNYEYDHDDVVNKRVTPYGIYVFTLRKIPIKIGDYVSVVGAVNYYSGTFQMQGISYHLEPDYKRDTLIGYSYNDNTGVKTKMERKTIKPIQLTGAQVNSLRLPSVLVEVTDNVYFYDFQEAFSTAPSGFQSLAEGGTEEINGYNDYYPFYNTNNNPYVWALPSSSEYTQASLRSWNISHRSNSPRYSNDLLRIVVNKETLLSDEDGNDCYSYRFLTGGEYYYNYHGAEYANEDADNPYLSDTIHREYEPKACYYKDHNDGFGVHGLIAISHGYESTSAKRKMTLEICSNSWAYVRLSTIPATSGE